MSYKLGDTWSRTFDYDGMLTKGMEAGVDWSIEDLQMLYTSFEDVNYHSENKHLGYAIEEMEEPGEDVNQAMGDIEDYLEDFNNACLATLKDMKIKWNPSTRTGSSLAMTTKGRANLKNYLANRDL